MNHKWTTVQIGELGRVVTGKTPPTADSANYGGELPFITPSDMKGQKYIDRTERTISAKGRAHVKNLLIPPNTVFVSCIGTDMGKVGMTRVESVTNQQINSIIVLDSIDHDYVYYNLFSRKDELQRLATSGSAQPILNKGHFSQLKMPLPPLPQQHAIANILGALDDKIELNKKMNETLEAMARAVFKSWFVDFDPVRAKAEGRDTGLPKEIADIFPDSFKDSELGEIPKGWESRSLYDSAEYINGAAYRDFHFIEEEGALPIVKIAELKIGITGQTKFTKTELNNKYRIDDGEILLSWSGNPDTSIDTFVWTGGAAWLNQHIFRVLPHIESEKYFIFYLLKYLRPVLAEIARNKQTTGLGHFTARDMKHMAVIYPPDKILHSFNTIGSPIFERWYENLFTSNTLAAIRDALLPKLISGEMAVPELEKCLEG